MNPLVAGITFLFVVGNLFSMLLDGTSGINTTTLSSNITAATLYIPITSSSGFPSSDSRIFVGDEEIRYDSIQSGADSNCASPPCLVLTSDDRGLNGTTAAAHNSGTQVNSELGGLLNSVVGFRMAEFSDLGTVEKVAKAPIFFVGAIANFASKVVLWDYSFLEGNAVYIKYTLLYPLSAGFVFAMIAFIRNTVLG